MLAVGKLQPRSPPPPPLSATNPTIINKPFVFLCRQLQRINYPLLLTPKRSGFSLFAQKKQHNSTLSKVQQKKSDLETKDLDTQSEVDEDKDDYDEFDDDDDDIDDDEVDDEDEVLVPYHKMDAWLEQKPKGFGEGKVYGTSIEDKLIEELEKIREAQAANIDKLKSGAKAPEPKKELEVKVSEVAPGYSRVRINNLPKKRNIHRDLKSAFEGVYGIANILPMVSGTKKTRDPVCKGFAFVDFKSIEDANRFVQLFSGQNIAFGKMEKRIKCEILKLSDGKSVNDKNHVISESRITVLEEEGDHVDDYGEHHPQLDYSEDDDLDELDEDSDDEDIMVDFKLLKSTGTKSDIESIESRFLKQMDSLENDDFDELDEDFDNKNITGKKFNLLNSRDNSDVGSLESKPIKKRVVGKNDIESIESRFLKQMESLKDDDFDDLDDDFDKKNIVRKKPNPLNLQEKSDVKSVESMLLKESSNSSSTKLKEKRVAKKPAVKKKPDNSAKPKIPGSAKRLKVHEKAKLAGAFSKYGAKQEALTSKETKSFTM